MNKQSVDKGFDPLQMMKQIQAMNAMAQNHVKKKATPAKPTTANGQSAVPKQQTQGAAKTGVPQSKSPSDPQMQKPQSQQPDVSGSQGSKGMIVQENYVADKNQQKSGQKPKTNLGDQYSLEPSEKIELCYDVRREGGNGGGSNNSNSVFGRFIVSNYRVRFIENGKRENNQEIYYSCSMPFGCILKVIVPVGGNISMDIITKDQRVFRFKFSASQQLESSYFAIMMSAQINRHSNLFAYRYLEGVQKLQKAVAPVAVSFSDVKQIVNADYDRLGAFQEGKSFQLYKFKSNLNRSFVTWFDITTKIGDEGEMEQGIFIPSGFPEDKITNSAQCRNDGRFPTMTYVNQKSGFQLWRCSELRQKSMGSEQAQDDVALIDQLVKQAGNLAIYSAREQNIGNTERNWGYESAQYYKKVEKQFYALSSKVKMVRAFESVWQLTNNIQDKNFMSMFIKTKWPGLIESVLQKSFDIVLTLKKHSVLIHCPTGSDGSCVLSSLAQIIMDPYYRTFEGFRALIYKEWIFFQHNFAKKSALLLYGSNGEQVNGQMLSNDIKASRVQMQAWQNVNNCKDYSPLFIFFLDCVGQLIRMNTHQFEFTTHYLAHFAFNCFTNKYYELTSPIHVYDQINGKKQSTDEVKLLSIFQLEQDKRNNLYRNQLYQNRGGTARSRNPMELDPTKITIWVEYFCRYDEGKKEYMTQQVQQAEANISRTVSLEACQNQLENEVKSLLEKLKANQTRINQIRNIRSQSQDEIQPEPVTEEKQEETAAAPEGETQTTKMVEEPKNGSIVLNATDLEVIATVEQRLKEIEKEQQSNQN